LQKKGISNSSNQEYVAADKKTNNLQQLPLIMGGIRPFHLAFPVTDIPKTREWYQEVLGCEIGRESDIWIDFNLFGHQIVAHLVEKMEIPESSAVDGKNVPAMHFGVILEWNQWHKLAERLKKSGIKFVIDPYIRYKGKPGEQATMFFKDPSGNHLEFKSFQSDEGIFAKEE